jgi:hypothetical protein
VEPYAKGFPVLRSRIPVLKELLHFGGAKGLHINAESPGSKSSSLINFLK